MHIRELTGYKQNDHYKKSQEIFHGDLSGVNNRISRLIQFQKYMVDNGFNAVGSPGQGGTAFEHPNYPWVFKIFTHDKAYFDYIQYARQHQNNPLIPKFKGNIIKINDNTFVVRIEKLHRISRNDQYNSLVGIISSIGDKSDIEWFMNNDPSRIQTLRHDYPKIFELMVDLMNTYPSHVLDLHRGNIMQRENGDLVVIDPMV